MTPEQEDQLCLLADRWQRAKPGKPAFNKWPPVVAYVDAMIAQARAEERERSIKIMRETTAKTLNLHYEQRAYSWHEIQDTMSECDKAIRARKDSTT